MTPSACPPADRLLHYVLGQLSETEAAAVDGHLPVCSGCVSKLDAFQDENDDLIRAVRSRRTAPQARNPVLSQLRDRIRSLAPPRAATTTIEVNVATPGNRAAVETLELKTLLAPAQTEAELGRLGPYRILKILGAGGMGVVFHAEDSMLGRPVALKVLKPALAANADFRQRFLREARMAASLQNDHVITIYQVGEVGGVALLAMQLLQGESLEERLQREGALPAADVLRIGREIAVGLDAAHQRGLIHRDIKPVNIWLEQGTGRVKILDFGLARATSADDTQLTQAGMVLGTPAYMAPEQAEGGPLDGRCDLFSLGCVLYRLATGVPAFQGLTPLAIMKAVTTVEPRPANLVNPEVPPALSELIQRLLAKNPADRPTTAQGVVDMIATLERSPLTGRRAGFTTTATPLLRHPEQPRPAAPSKRRLPAGLAIAAGLAVAVVLSTLVVVGLILGLGLFQPGTEPIAQSTEKDAKESKKDPQETGKKPGDGVVKVDRPINFASLVSAPTHIEGLKSWNIEADDTVMVHRIAYSPKGRHLFFATWTPNTAVIAAGSWDFTKGGLVTPSAFVPPPQDLATSPDGKIQARQNGNKVVLSKVDDKEWTRSVLGLAAVDSFLFYPDSKWLVIMAGADGILAVDMNADTKKTLMTGGATHVLLGWLADGKTLVSGVGPVGPIFLWDVAGGKLAKKCELPFFSKYWTTISPDGKLMTTFQSESTLLVFDPLTGKEVHKLTNTTRPTSAAFAGCLWSPDSKHLVYRGKDNGLCLLEIATGTLKEWLGHAKEIYNFAFAPDGKTFASYGADNTTRLWSAATGQHLGSLVFLKDGGWLAISPDGHYRGSSKPRAEESIRYVVQTPDGVKRELSPADFANKYNWKNQPERVLLTPEARSLIGDPFVQKK